MALAIESSDPRLAAALGALALAPTAEGHRLVAVEYRRLGILDAAYAEYAAARRRNPGNAAAYDGLARIWRDWGYANVGLPHAYRAVYWAPDSAAAQNTLGTLLLKLGVFDAAHTRFEQARALAPDAAYPPNNLCYLELQRADTGAAVSLCREAAALDPASNTVRNNLALALALAGDVDAAFSEFESGPSPAIAAYNQGIVLLAARQFGSRRRVRRAAGGPGIPAGAQAFEAARRYARGARRVAVHRWLVPARFEEPASALELISSWSPRQCT